MGIMLPEAPGGSGGNGEEVLGARASPTHSPSLSLSCTLRVLSVEETTNRIKSKESRPGSLSSGHFDFAPKKV